MRLGELIRASGIKAELRGDEEVEVSSLAFGERRVGPGTLFFCARGLRRDGHDFAPAAVEAGASALVVERPLELGVTEVKVPSGLTAIAPIAAALHGDPTARLAVVAITGTNGKTTTAFLVHRLLEAAGWSCGLLGTVQRVVGGKVRRADLTTPESIDLQAAFAEMLAAGDRACAMEVSSHALALRRADAIHFAARVFTNLTQDHLDFHGSMERYFAAKRRLFTGSEGRAVINVDDPYGRRLVEELAAEWAEPPVTFSATGLDADLSATQLAFGARGARFRCLTPAGPLELSTRLPGHFNVANVLAALGAVHTLGLDLPAAAAALPELEPVPGRFEPIDAGQPFGVLVDYAHTPDALQNVLDAARRLTTGRLLSVFGCGGDRDRQKRPLMGLVGAELSDLAVITSDNPRSESPETIIEEILDGIEDRGSVAVEPDRRAAIALALARARPGDLVVVAGKGHEGEQELERGRRVPFDDRAVARDELRRLHSEWEH